MPYETKQAEEFIASIDCDKAAAYENYFDEIMPKTQEDIFRRGLFAFASAHTTWASNCRLYEQLYDLDWIAKPDVLRHRLHEARAGLHNNREKFLSHYAAMYWNSPEWFVKRDDEGWQEYRARIQKTVNGLGPAKSAFFIELVYFHKAHVCCFDVHLLRLYGLPGHAGVKQQAMAEQHWVDTCLARGINPVTARWLYWDKIQGRNHSSYWAYVLEGAPSGPKQLELFTEFVA